MSRIWDTGFDRIIRSKTFYSTIINNGLETDDSFNCWHSIALIRVCDEFLNIKIDNIWINVFKSIFF
jgi:hypothetical protein